MPDTPPGTIHVGIASDDLCPDDMRLDSDLDLIAEFADVAAQHCIMTYLAEDWRRSPVRRMLAMAEAKMRGAGRPLSSAMIEAQECFRAAESRTA